MSRRPVHLLSGEQSTGQGEEYSALVAPELADHLEELGVDAHPVIRALLGIGLCRRVDLADLVRASTSTKNHSLNPPRFLGTSTSTRPSPPGTLRRTSAVCAPLDASGPRGVVGAACS
jgi:hypothetical protein